MDHQVAPAPHQFDGERLRGVRVDDMVECLDWNELVEVRMLVEGEWLVRESPFERVHEQRVLQQHLRLRPVRRVEVAVHQEFFKRE